MHIHFLWLIPEVGLPDEFTFPFPCDFGCFPAAIDDGRRYVSACSSIDKKICGVFKFLLYQFWIGQIFDLGMVGRNRCRHQRIAQFSSYGSGDGIVGNTYAYGFTVFVNMGQLGTGREYKRESSR